MTVGPQPSRIPLRLLQIYVLTLFIFPSNYVIRAIGASGYVASLVALVLFFLWLLTAFLGFHNPMRERTPALAVYALLWASTLASYISLMAVGTDETGQLAADREILQLAGITGVAFMITYGLRGKRQLLDFLDVLVWAACISVLIAALQRWLHVDLTPTLGGLPGFEINGINDAFTARSGQWRVAGSALSPIEFAVACGMVLPIAVVRGIIKVDAGAVKRWLPALLCLLGAAISVSRSGFLAVAISMTVLMFMLPAKERFIAILCVPAALVVLFGILPGFFATMWGYIAHAGADSSIQWRTADYATVARLVPEAPWIGHGPGWYLPPNALDILDNEYLGELIDTGVIGLLAYLTLVASPAVICLITRQRTDDPDLRLVCAAVAAASLAAVASSAAFDLMSFPICVGMVAVVNGLASGSVLQARALRSTQSRLPADVSTGV